jgi:FkbM family methyltransferase
LAVEPLAEVANLLRQNVSQFGVSRSTVLEAAVSDRVGTGSIVSVEGNLGMSHVAELGQGQPTEFIDFPVLLAAAGPPDVIKIDVEGHEVAVLTGIAPAIKAHRPALVVFEHHRGDEPPDQRIVDVFSSLNYDLQRIWRRWSGWQLGPATGEGERGYERSEDFAAVRRDR